ncbi:DUF1330 domain-containing protein [Ulvibacterium marinum]|uniref:DUF1330 domain-containing protein n=1 Tax=Ulvibacterium marinum TaxID=2419782 RepID=A0A3B0BXG8_9FLAO|nr:DUF1330 domain-containing protein [Ulvibacterium marinum]RKN78173.1 DUF1330 domain-containing protein [Ulvibacterium marinum]
MKTYIGPTDESQKEFYLQFKGKGPITMLNLVKFKPIAEYSGTGMPQAKERISGKEAYAKYLELTLPVMKKAGGNIKFYGSCGDFLIGPENKGWDAVLLVEYESVDVFVAFAQSEAYLKNAGHRTASLEDSRLLPIVASEL